MNDILNSILLGKGLNQGGWRPVIDIMSDNSVQCDIFSDHKDILTASKGYKFGVLLGYNKKVPQRVLSLPEKSFILFHSSDLPKGRGWAPIYYTITRQLPLTVTLLFASEEIDQGNLIAKATYNLAGNEVEKEVRAIDDYLTLELLRKALPHLLNKKVNGISQKESEASWWPKRSPKDSIIDKQNRFYDLVDHLRALPEESPAFFDFNGRRFYLMLEPEPKEKLIDENKINIETYF